MIAQRQQQHLEKHVKQTDNEGRLLKMQHGRRVAAADEIALILNDACAESRLNSDIDVESGDVEEKNIVSASALARSVQLSRDRRTNIQDALIHRFLHRFHAIAFQILTRYRSAMQDAYNDMKLSDEGVEKLIELEVAFLNVRSSSGCN